jgi:glycine oxidase
MTSAVIVGGGVIGLSIAWRAAQRGIAVTVADPASGRGASYAAAGMLTPVSEAAYAERDLLNLGLASLERYAAFASELTSASGEPTGFRRTGTLQIGYDADDLAVIEELGALQEALGVPAASLSARECRALEPMLDPSIRGGLFVEGDGSVDPRLLTRALRLAALATGITLIPHPVAEVLHDHEGFGASYDPKLSRSRNPAVLWGDAGEAGGGEGRVTGVRLSDGSEVDADFVVLAAGWSSANVKGVPAEYLPPVRPVKGQILRLRATPGSGPVVQRSVRGIVRGASIYLVPRESGELVIGATQEELGADTTVTAGGVWELLRDARMLVPGITELEFAEVVAGLRPGTPDNAPVLGPCGLPGLVLATGHFRSGVLLAPVTADVIADYLETGCVPGVAAPFSIGRFAPGTPDADAVPHLKPSTYTGFGNHISGRIGRDHVQNPVQVNGERP